MSGSEKKARTDSLPPEEYENRVQRLQKEMKRSGIDLFVGYSSETESASSRYLTGFWPFFDFAGVLVPVEGDAVLVTGGPESYEFAKRFSTVPKIEINPLFVETSAPEWVPHVEGKSFAEILPDVAQKAPKVIGIGNENIFPYPIMEDLQRAVPGAEFVDADEVFLKVQAVKSNAEIPYIKEVYRITENAMKAALDSVRPGMQEWEPEAIARMKMLEQGAEGMPYPSWVCSGPNTVLSLCRSTNRRIQENELVQFTFGAKFRGYCGNMCRPFAIGKVPEKARHLMEVALEATEYALQTIRPGVPAHNVFNGYHTILKKYGYEEFTLYGPAHGTGSSEVEGLWLSKNADFLIEPNMLFNIDIWLSDGSYGLRFEEGVLVNDNGLDTLNPFKREIIEL